MKLIDFLPEHKESFFKMCSDFFSSPAVCHPISREAMEKTFQTALATSPYMRGLIITKEKEVIGYLLLSFTYSNEVGGMVVWIEEIFIQEAHRHKGYGKEVLKWIIDTYKSSVKRFRLEVTDENKAAKKLYEKIGFSDLNYRQMTLEEF
ncbi:MAG: GNAT family N-acetyltransferase [Clostridia bacterium]|nr:GNAT family N-acetyltransferase [Clostridia bacterium]